MAEVHPIPTDPRFKNLKGRKYGRLTVVSYAGVKNRSRLWTCICDCGKIAVVHADSLRARTTNSCGCLKDEKQGTHSITHGKTKTRTYTSWCAMRKRCRNSSSHNYSYYGGRGIRICERWNSFENFLEDMGERPNGTSIDRINPNGNYCKENCRWASDKEQKRNKRNTSNLTIDGTTRSVSEWSEISGINKKTIWNRIYCGWDIKEAVFSKNRHWYVSRSVRW